MISINAMPKFLSGVMIPTAMSAMFFGLLRQRYLRIMPADALIDKASRFLNKSGIRQLIDKIEQRIPAGEEITRQRKWLYMIESLARQIKDGTLFEQTRQRNWQGLNGRAYIEIAKVYFSAGDASTAYDRLQKAAECGAKNEYEYSELFREVSHALGKVEDVVKISWEIFRRTRCKETLNELLAQIGEDNRAEVIYKEVDLISRRGRCLKY
ncbi:MAG: hypothetical protein KJ893_08250 [Candidatus Omnitrophica bacterium]|nr:hypothetical protein [Candidatus Omnitrophota bacterium]MBU4477762.1 hypothetical protein [Candidatus Omnitrophota bacterium]